MEKQKFIDYLKSKQVFDDIDNLLTGVLIDLIEHSKHLNDEVKDSGYVVTSGQNTKSNPAYSDYLKTINAILAYSSKLGITVQDRQKLKLQEEEVDQLKMFD